MASTTRWRLAAWRSHWGWERLSTGSGIGEWWPRLRSPDSASGGEERFEQTGGLGGQQPVHQLDAMVEPPVLRDVVQRPRRTRLGIGCPVDDAVETRPHR